MTVGLLIPPWDQSDGDNVEMTIEPLKIVRVGAAGDAAPPLGLPPCADLQSAPVALPPLRSLRSLRVATGTDGERCCWDQVALSGSADARTLPTRSSMNALSAGRPWKATRTSTPPVSSIRHGSTASDGRWERRIASMECVPSS